MHTVYNIAIYFATAVLRIVALFSQKIASFMDGRKDIFQILQQKISVGDKTIWFHCASLGEYEQGVPIMEAFRKRWANYKIIVTFFSPSGFEVKKNSPLADAVVYLPLDTPGNAKKFLTSAHPTIALFVKYEFWPNYLFELQNRKVPAFLISGVFRKNQIFFKSYGGFMRKALATFDHLFVQDENSEMLLKNIGFKNVTLSGDTRFDRVSQQLEMDNNLKFAENFKGNSLCIVCGSTWPEDENMLAAYINSAPDGVKFIIAPHRIDTSKIQSLRDSIVKKTILRSEMDSVNISQYTVLIIDCIGLLAKLYRYANIAYVGGAMGNTGLHNILEPAAFGVPIVIGKNFSNFPEAVRLKELGGLFVVRDAAECSAIMERFRLDPKFRTDTGSRCDLFIKENTGATKIIVEFIANHQPFNGL